MGEKNKLLAPTAISAPGRINCFTLNLVDVHVFCISMLSVCSIARIVGKHRKCTAIINMIIFFVIIAVQI